jgi:hypothetical protein
MSELSLEEEKVMNLTSRSLCSSLSLLALLTITGSSAFSQGPSSPGQGDSGSLGTLTINFRYKGEIIGRGEFKDRTTYDQTASIVCPVTGGDVTTVSSILGPSKEQENANNQLGAAAKKEIDAIPPQAVSGMKSLEKQMKECKSSGKSEQVCGLQIMAATQANPELMEQLGAVGNADPAGMAGAESAVAAAAGNYQPWFNEGCTGTMTVKNSFQLDDPTIPGPEPVLWTTGTRKIETSDTLVTVETDLNRKETRYLFIPPQETFPRDATPGEKPTQETLAAIPANPLLAGPYPGPIQSGRYEKPLNGGSYVVEWAFSRG